MAARKLQSEIERTLKKVTEGVELFESIYEKMQSTANPTQKDKLETDLKTQIKKLQRMRDQIKSWIQSNDIKDKSQLIDYRKLIETQMEKFKACEKEMKTKAFSKEGLIAAMRLDPAEKAKHECRQWLENMIEELTRQVEVAEAEIETLGSTKRKHKGQANERQTELEQLNERRKWHSSRLEIVLRLLENGSLVVESVNDLRDNVSFFVESNGEEGFEEDEAIYDELNLDEQETALGLGADETSSDDDGDDDSEDIPTLRTPAKNRKSVDHDDERETPSRKESISPTMKKAPVVQLRPRPGPIPTPNFAQQSMSSAVKANLPARAPQPTIKYAAAAAAGISNSPAAAPAPPPPQSSATTGPSTPSASTNGSFVSSPPAPSTDSNATANASSPSLTQHSLSTSSPLISTIASPPEADITSVPVRATPPPQSLLESYGDSPVSHSPSDPAQYFSSSPKRAPSGPSVTDSPYVTQAPVQEAIAAPANGAQPSNFFTAQQPVLAQQPPAPPPGLRAQSPPVPSNIAQQSLYPPAYPLHVSPVAPPQQQYVQRPINPALGDVMESFEGAKQKSATRMQNLDQVQKQLEVGYHNLPQPQDTEKPKYYVPRNPYNTPSYYPQQPIASLSTPSVFASLDVDTLFYVFYFLPGTYQQYLAAKELKKQSWRFHLKYLTWFQRHSEPQAITDEYEQGVYVYFDWEGSWCQRKKSDFRFEYRYLSED
ncbi:Not1 N-terminal domain, CCR4-Not complex component-domain-containing protein [Auriculariales sp. MPI-PUGE-AT-0066]|nr:Not1 N-terminal domain, CCR4-Not complex component-domain-containing protein [Auriculariales sp. MPI-PUGE-AT-0066]